VFRSSEISSRRPPPISHDATADSCGTSLLRFFPNFSASRFSDTAN
jgi:hypothetical protein